MQLKQNLGKFAVIKAHNNNKKKRSRGNNLIFLFENLQKEEKT